MIQTKAHAKIYFSYYPGSFDSESDPGSSTVDTKRVNMGKKASTSSRNVIHELRVKKISPRKVPYTLEAYKIYVLNYFITKIDAIVNDWDYRNISVGYAKPPNSHSGSYNEAGLDKKFAWMIVVKEPYTLKMIWLLWLWLKWMCQSGPPFS